LFKHIFLLFLGIKKSLPHISGKLFKSVENVESAGG